MNNFGIFHLLEHLFFSLIYIFFFNLKAINRSFPNQIPIEIFYVYKNNFNLNTFLRCYFSNYFLDIKYLFFKSICE